MNIWDALENWSRSQYEKDQERKQRGVASRAMQDSLLSLDEVGDLGRDGPAYIKYNPLVGVLRGVASLPDLFQLGTAAATDSLQSSLEGLGMSRNDSDRLGRDVLALTNEYPAAEIAPFAGLLDKAQEFGSMSKKMRPYLLGEKLETNPDSANLAKIGKPAAVAIDGERYSSRDVLPIKMAEEKYLKEQGIDIPDFIAYPDQDVQRAKLIAAAFEDMKNAPDDPKVKAAYDALIEETLAQYKAIEDSGISFKFLREGQADPYASTPALGYKDIVENKNLTVFPTDFGYGTDINFDPSANPLLTPVGRVGDKENAVANDAFRVVHDIFGHMGSGNPQFRPKGEERAWLQHSRMFSPEARGAMTTETRGQNSWLNFGPYADKNRGASGADTIYADQKVGLMPDWTYDPEGMPDGLERRRLEQIIRSWER